MRIFENVRASLKNIYLSSEIYALQNFKLTVDKEWKYLDDNLNKEADKTKIPLVYFCRDEVSTSIEFENSTK